MTSLDRYRFSSSSHLLMRILEMPALPLAIRELPAPALAKLIEHVGLEDAGELIALASFDQLQRIWDEDLWLVGSEEEERFSIERFALWLSIMCESGDEFVTRLLSDMPIDLLTLAVQRSMLVVDMDATRQQLSNSYEDAARTESALEGVVYQEWEQFALVARDPSTWDVIWNALLMLDRDHHELLRGVLERCAWAVQQEVEECGGLDALLNDVELLESEANDERDLRRAQRGYVSSADARAFIAFCRLDEPLEVRDAITAAYFRRLQGESVVPVEQPHTTGLSRERGQALFQMLRDADVLTDTAPALYAAGQLSAGAEPGTIAPPDAGLMALLRKLQTTDSECYAQRLEEIGYLANLLLSLPVVDRASPHRMRPIDALETATAVCDLGLAHCLQNRAAAHGADDERGLWVLRETSADRLFRHGMRVLHADPSSANGKREFEWLRWLVG